jgi:hypothetical protein
MPVPNTVTDLVTNAVDVIQFDDKFDVTVFDVNLVSMLVIL